MASTFTVAYTATPLAANTKAVIEATQPLGNGVTFVKPTLYRQIFVTTAAAASPADIASAYIAKFGAFTTGHKIGVRVTIITSDGQKSAPITSLLAI